MRILHNNHGQGIVVEYAMTFFLVVAFVSSMTVYVRRTVQARVRGAQKYVTQEVEKLIYDPKANLVGRFYKQYEPYYANYTADRTQMGKTTERMRPAGRDGIYERVYNELSIFESRATQHPPAYGD